MTTPVREPCPMAVVIPVEGPADVIVVQSRARHLAAALGFGRRAQWEIATAASELATNILKFGEGGTIHLEGRDTAPVRIDLVARDRGPGISGAEDAVRDGFSEGVELGSREAFWPQRGLGCGLGAVERLMGRVSIRSGSSGRGAEIRARRYLESDGAGGTEDGDRIG